MKMILEFVKSVVIGGFLVLLPLLVIILVFGELLGLLALVTDPITSTLPFDAVTNTALATLITITEAILICFIAGFVVRTRWGGALLQWMERTVLEKMPIYVMIKNLTRKFSGLDSKQFIPVEVDLFGSESRMLGLIVEELPDDRLAVFIPSVPATTVGQLHLLPRDKVKVLDTSLGSFVNSISQWGVGTKKIYSK
jgi:uncharacterized membrane protein